MYSEQMQADCYFSKAKVAVYSSLGVRTIERAIARGELRIFRPHRGRKLLLRKSDVDAWISAGEITRTPQSARSASGLDTLLDAAIAKARRKLAGTE
jgi:excisionase family DNA binding protein